jgi:hypothetical protein
VRTIPEMGLVFERKPDNQRKIIAYSIKLSIGKTFPEPKALVRSGKALSEDWGRYANEGVKSKSRAVKPGFAML